MGAQGKSRGAGDAASSSQEFYGRRCTRPLSAAFRQTAVAPAGWWCARAAEAAEDPEGRGGPHEDTDGIDPCEAAAADRVFAKVQLINVLFYDRLDVCSLEIVFNC